MLTYDVVTDILLAIAIAWIAAAGALYAFNRLRRVFFPIRRPMAPWRSSQMRPWRRG